MFYDRYLSRGRSRSIAAAGVLATAGIFLIIDHSLLRYPGPGKLWSIWFDEEPARQPADAWLVWAGLVAVTVGVAGIGVLMQTARKRVPSDPPDSDDVPRFQLFGWLLLASWSAAVVAYLSSPDSELRDRTLQMGIALPFVTFLGLWFAGEWSIARGHRRYDDVPDP